MERRKKFNSFLFLLIFFPIVCNCIPNPHWKQCEQMFKKSNLFMKSEEGMKCVNAVPISKETKETTLKTIYSLLQLYVFHDIVRDSPSSSPLSHVGIGINAEIDYLLKRTVDNATINSFEFHQLVSDHIFRPLKDAHTQFTKPKCFDGSLIQPFSLHAQKNGKGEMEIRVNGIYSVASNISFWNNNALLDQIGKRITHVNGISITEAISQFSQEYSFFSKDPSVNFNAFLMGGWFNIRPLTYGWSYIPKDSFEWTFEDSETMVIPWALWFTGDLSQCSKKTQSRLKRNDGIERDWFEIQKSKIWPHVRDEIVTSNGTLSKPSDMIASIRQGVHILRIPSFRANAAKDAMSALSSLPGSDKLILDLRSNGGGYVCEGLFLVEALTEKPPPLLYDLRRSEELNMLVEDAKINHDNPGSNLFGPRIWSKPGHSSNFSDWYEPREIHRGGITGEYSQLLEYSRRNCPGAPTSPIIYEKILIVTDGNCGSTCAIASTLLSLNHSYVQTVATGGLDSEESMSYSTFPGGIKVNDEDAFSWFEGTKKHLGHLSPKRWTTTSRISFTFAELYLSQNQSYPEEFTFLASDYRIRLWPSLDTQSSNLLYDQVIPLFKGVAAKSKWNLTIGLISVSILTVIIILSVLISCIVLRRKNKRKQLESKYTMQDFD
eukprot:TRINITY_DN1331_c0_g1_i1.p1 TRINITY_DN1331_c0_g1~~TRINITY_DN1331_c0_g1_i1.p1  ORF type:complete len:661 (-),score=118.50 TRINITY_DN1331_c0_g1_i1:160-2142(-)